MDNIFNYSKKEILRQLKINIPNKLLLVAEAFRKKISLNTIYKLSKVDPWFLNQIKEIVDEEQKIIKYIDRRPPPIFFFNPLTVFKN